MKESTQQAIKEVINNMTDTVCDTNRTQITIDGSGQLMTPNQFISPYELLQEHTKIKDAMNIAYNILNRINDELEREVEVLEQVSL